MKPAEIIGLLCILITSVSPGPMYVRSGADITECDMTCPQDDVTLELYRHCGGKEKRLLEHHCLYNKTIYHDPRLHLDTRSGCWKLTPARKDDSCVYKIWCHCDKQHLASSTDIRVLDPVHISNITSNCSRLGQDIAVSVQYSGEESAVTWEVDGEPLPERYRLIDDNRTLIIPSVQRDDAERTFRVRITNPVSEETRDHRLEIRDSDPYRRTWGLIGVPAVMVVISIIFWICYWKKRVQEIPKPANERNGFVHTMENGPDHIEEEDSFPCPTKMENGPGPTKARENGPGPMKGNGHEVHSR